jgi:hypothetical protein
MGLSPPYALSPRVDTLEQLGIQAIETKVEIHVLQNDASMIIFMPHAIIGVRLCIYTGLSPSLVENERLH